MDKRNFTRVEFSECASVKHDGQVFFSDIKNVSLQGMFVQTNQDVPLHATVEITVYRPPDSSFRVQANVVRCEKTGLGLTIKDMDVNSFVHLRELVTTRCNDQDLIMRETYKMAGCIH
jgi:PilZ domain